MFHACEMPQVWNGHVCEILLHACEMLLHTCYMEFYTWSAYLHATRNVVHANTRREQYILVSCSMHVHVSRFEVIIELYCKNSATKELKNKSI